MAFSIRNNFIAHNVWNGILSIATIISPELNTRMYYRTSQGKRINLKNPIQFNEKILWLKLNTYMNNDLVRQCSDKYAVRSYVERKGCGETLNPLLKVYDSADEIKLEDLPQRFALKLNYGCTYNIICTNKNQFDLGAAKTQLSKWMRSKYYLVHSEMQYKNVERKILLEQYIENQDGAFPDDFKFYCFNGEPMYLLHCTERNVDHASKTFCDIEGNIVPFRTDCSNHGFVMPPCYLEMLQVCRKLSEGFPFVRVDLYNSDGKVVFGELTFSPAGGTGKYTEEGSRVLGELIRL